MKTINTPEKKFDSTNIMRKIRDEISLEIMDMSYIEEKEYINRLLAKSKVVKSIGEQCGTTKR